MANAELGTCGRCHRTKHPDGFPSTDYLVCWECSWVYHLERRHPGIVDRMQAWRTGDAERTSYDVRAHLNKLAAEESIPGMFGAHLPLANGVKGILTGFLTSRR